MKKLAVVVITLVLVMLLANTALAKYIDSSDDLVTAKSGSFDVKIIERTKSTGNGAEYSEEIIDGTSSVNEKLSNLAPGDEVVLSYKIINNGSIDVLLDGVNISIDNQELSKDLYLKWTITQFADSQPVNSTSNSLNGKSLKSVSTSTNVSFEGIVLDNNNITDDFCVLELKISFDENAVLSSTSKETIFTITPSFRQY